MKKILFAVLASTFASALMGDYVYDYKASIKRINPTYKNYTATVRGSKYATVSESYSVVSDSIKGYIVTKECVGCDTQNTSLATSSLDQKAVVAYLTRTGDKKDKYIWQVDATYSANVFGAFIYPTEGNPQKDASAAKKAWMDLDYSIPAEKNSKFVKLSEYVNVKADRIPSGYDKAYYGFLGLDNYGPIKVVQTGFGTASSAVTPGTEGSLGCLEPQPGKEPCSKITVKSISGTLVGDATYDGLCGNIPMWDVCKTTVKAHVAGFSGTWTLKLNTSLTKSYNNATNDSDAKLVLIKKLGGSALSDVTDGTTPATP